MGNQGPTINYYLESAYTGTKENYLVIETENDVAGYTFSLTGDGFTAEVPLETSTPLQERTQLDYTLEGKYALGLDIKRSDGVTFISENLTWEYSTEKPPKPQASFEELATNDNFVNLLLVSNLGEKTIDIWIEGDLAEKDKPGYWVEIPSDLKVPIEIDPEEGVKNFTIKYRNIYRNESEEETLSITKKSQGPVNCEAHVISNTVKTNVVRMNMAADNIGDLYYKVIGDLDFQRDFIKFSNSVEVDINLSEGEGEKNLKVFIKDAADNFCPTEVFTVTVDPSHVSNDFYVNENGIYTDDPFVNVTVIYDHLPSDDIQMKFLGNFRDADNIGVYIPYQRDITLELSPYEGTRNLFVKLKHDGVELQGRMEYQIHLRPSVKLNSSNELVISEIVGMTSVTIQGCTQAYNNVSFQTSYPCVFTGDSVTVTYALDDGTSLVRSVDAP